MLKTLSIAAAVIGFAATLSAQTAAPGPDTFKVSYYSNANGGGPDGTVRITNVGTNITTPGSGNLCALIYVFEPDQQMAECCGCLITPDGLLTLSIDTNLASNPLTPVTLTTGAIKIVSSAGGACNPSKPTPVTGIRAWGTHIQAAGVVTETEFVDSTLSTGELNLLKNKCGSILSNGSGFGVCSCGTGG
jgi:hypothetical protein